MYFVARPWFIFGALFLLLSPLAMKAWILTQNPKAPLQLSRDGGITASLASLDKGDVIILRDSQGKEVWSYMLDKTAQNLALSADGKYLVVVGSGVRLFSVAEKKQLWYWPKDGRNEVSVNSDGSWFALGGYQENIYLFNKASSQPVKTWNLGKKEDSPASVAMSDDAKSIAAASSLATYFINVDETSIKWSAKTEERPHTVKLSQDGRYMLGVAAHSVYFWDTKSSTPRWQKKWKGSLIGADMTLAGDKVVVSHQTGVSVFDAKGKELRKFENSFGNSDIVMSRNGRYFYVNGGSRKLYAFDDSYSTSELRPFRIVQDMNAGGHVSTVLTSPTGNWFTYPKSGKVIVEESKPAVLALSPGIPLWIKDGVVDMGGFVTNPTAESKKMHVRVSLSLPASMDWWEKVAGKVGTQEPSSVKSKLLSYVSEQLPGHEVIHEEDVTLAAGTSNRFSFSTDVPDLGAKAGISDKLAGAMSTLSPAALLSKLFNEIRGPLGKLVGKDVANLAVTTASRSVSAATGEVIIPTLGMGTMTIYDAQGKPYDQDSFYFLYLR